MKARLVLLTASICFIFQYTGSAHAAESQSALSKTSSKLRKPAKTEDGKGATKKSTDKKPTSKNRASISKGATNPSTKEKTSSDPQNPAADSKLPSPIGFSSGDIWNVDIFNQEDHKVLVIQDRKYTKAKKIELGLNAGVTAASAYFSAYSYGVHAAYHINEYFGIEAFYDNSSSSSTREKRQIDDFLDANEFSTTIEQQNPLYFYGVNLIWSPIYGKFAFFRSNIIHFDIFGTVGASMMGVGSNITGVKDQSLPGSLLGAGIKVYLTKNTAFRMEAKNNIYRTTYAALIKQDGSNEELAPAKKVWWSAWHYMMGVSYNFGLNR